MTPAVTKFKVGRPPPVGGGGRREVVEKEKRGEAEERVRGGVEEKTRGREEAEVESRVGRGGGEEGEVEVVRAVKGEGSLGKRGENSEERALPLEPTVRIETR